MNPKVVIVSLIISVGIVGIGLLVTFQKPSPSQTGNLDNFANCLSQKKVTMYGAAWCAHCQAQKKLFGDSFKIVPYVECPNNPQKCLDAGVNSYPTWITSDGKKYEGEQTLESISQFSQCPLR